MLAKEMVAINRAMQNPDGLVIQLRYIDKAGVVTERVVSPIRWLGGHSLLALCLCRETPRRFELARCSDIRLLRAEDVLMPVPIRTIEPASSLELVLLSSARELSGLVIVINSVTCDPAAHQYHRHARAWMCCTAC